MHSEDRQAAMVLLGRVMLGGAILALLFYAFYPGPNHPRLLSWDKAEHFLAFGLIAILAMIAFPRLRPVATILTLAAACCLVELIQGLALVHRQSGVADGLVGVIGAAIGVAMVTATRRIGRPPPASDEGPA